jgi:hypothetical protein
MTPEVPPQQGGCLGPAVGNIGVSNPEALSGTGNWFLRVQKGKITGLQREKSHLRARQRSTYGHTYWCLLATSPYPGDPLSRQHLD